MKQHKNCSSLGEPHTFEVFINVSANFESSTAFATVCRPATFVSYATFMTFFKILQHLATFYKTLQHLQYFIGSATFATLVLEVFATFATFFFLKNSSATFCNILNSLQYLQHFEGNAIFATF